MVKLIDAVLYAGELSPEREFLGNNAMAVKVVAKNLDCDGLLMWLDSKVRADEVREMYERGERILGSAIRRAAYRVRIAAVPHAPGEPPDLSQQSLARHLISAG